MLISLYSKKIIFDPIVLGSNTYYVVVVINGERRRGVARSVLGVNHRVLYAEGGGTQRLPTFLRLVLQFACSLS